MAVRPIGPGAGAYNLPPTIGYENHDNRRIRRPQYSFGIRTKQRDLGIGPGPGAYKCDGIDRNGVKYSPQYSFGLRTKIIDKSSAPGPGAHNNHNAPEFRGQRAPAYTMGVKTKMTDRNFSPGPNTYAFSMNTVKPNLPSYSMGMRTRVKTDNTSPGPSAYGANNIDVIKNKRPAYTLGLMTKGVGAKNISPGPAIYNLMAHKPGDSGASYSFGVHHHPYAPPMIVECDN